MRKTGSTSTSPDVASMMDDDDRSPRGSFDSGASAPLEDIHPGEDEWCAMDAEGSTSHEYYDCDVETAEADGTLENADTARASHVEEDQDERDADARSLPPFPIPPDQDNSAGIEVSHLPSRPVSPTNSVIYQRGPETPSEPIVESPTQMAPPQTIPMSGEMPFSSDVFTNNMDRSARRRTFDSRGSRLSGFFSNLLHISTPRDAQEQTIAPSRSSLQEPFTPTASKHSQTHSQTLPQLSVRPQTPPPPALPPPTLHELGLELNIIAASSHPFVSTPPTSGTFLQPHYLLLCHSQGLDVLPLISPPARLPYALVRRVPFKTVVVMEERGVMVAIAGRRDGVRVYALDEVKRAVEWRIEVEREKARKEESKRTGTMSSVDLKGKAKARPGSVFEVTLPTVSPTTFQSPTTSPTATDIINSTTPSPPPTYSTLTPTLQPPTPPSRLITRSSISNLQLVRPPTTIRRPRKERADNDEKNDHWDDSDEEPVLVAAEASGSAALDERTSALSQSQSAPISGPALGLTFPTPPNSRDRSVSAPLLSTAPSFANLRRRPTNLDLAPPFHPGNAANPNEPPPSPAPTLLSLRAALGQRPASPNSSGDEQGVPRNEVITLAQALQESRLPQRPVPNGDSAQPIENIAARPSAVGTPSVRSGDSTATRARKRWSALGTLFNSSTPPPTSTSPPISPLTSTRGAPPAPNSFSVPPTPARASQPAPSSRPSPNRLSRISSNPNPMNPRESLPPSSPRSNRTGHNRFLSKILTAVRNSGELPSGERTGPARIRGPNSRNVTDNESDNERDRQRRFSTAMGLHPGSIAGVNKEASNNPGGIPVPIHLAPAPKLEYVKLPGTKGALMIKAVETPKKSFLAILCGDLGERVELFAGTYRTALGLSRTFILPDSPRSLELQLQGDDLVELFLVFGQNVFGLEPATVRVREVRIGRAERRAARRRAMRDGASVSGTDPNSLQTVDESTVITTVVSVGDNPVPDPELSGDPVQRTVSLLARSGTRRRSLQVQGRVVESSPGPTSPMSPEGDEQTTDAHIPTITVSNRAAAANSGVRSVEVDNEIETATRNNQGAEELAALAAAQVGPYTTFQQLSFAPLFPLATIVEDYLIPPTYPHFVEYKQTHESHDLPRVLRGDNGTTRSSSDDPRTPEDVLTRPPSPPQPQPTSLPTPLPKWYYRDPKGIIRGPWKSSLMQTWLREGYLPPTLPVRRASEEEYILLRDLCGQSIDPDHPFQPLPPPPPAIESTSSQRQDATSSGTDAVQSSDLPAMSQILLSPISLLEQPKHFGPPALFFSSRGGHSTTIVDARGRSVLKGRFVWSSEDSLSDFGFSSTSRLGDIKRVEAFDSGDRAVIVALRQGGMEALDVGDALLSPGDQSRNVLPTLNVSVGETNRRGNFIYRIGGRIGQTPPTAVSAASRLAMLTKKPALPVPKKLASKKNDSALPSTYAETLAAMDEDIVFLGRNIDDVYFCERNGGSFRILHLSPLR